MRKARKCESGFFFIHFSSCQKGEDDLRELVHHGDHSFPVAESLLSLLVIVGTEERGIHYGSLGHYVDILSEAPVAMLGDVATAMAFSGLVDGRIGTHVCDELLVGCESGDVLDLCHEMGCCDFTDSRDGLEYLHLLLVYFLFMLYESLCECFVSLLKVQYLLSAVLHEVSIPRHSYASDGIALDVLHGDGKIAALLLYEGIHKLRVISGKDLIWRGKKGKEAEHGRCKHINGKDFRPRESKIALQLCLCPGDILSNFLPSSRYASYLVIHDVLLPMESIVIGKAISCNAESISAVGLGLAQRRGLYIVLDHHRILDTDAETLADEEMAEVLMVAPCGFHDEYSVLWDSPEERAESVKIHFAAASGEACSIPVDDPIVELPACDVDACDIAHGFTSWVMKDGSPHPISRVNEALRLNQPIGIERELGQTTYEALGLGKRPSSVPSIISFMTPCYGIYC